MTIKDVFDYVDEIYENTFDDEVKIIWLNQIEAEIQVEVLLTAVEGIVQYNSQDLYAELIVPAPFSKIYPEYLVWRIMVAQGEAERANNQQVVLDEAWKAYARFVAETVDPKNGLAQTMRYYLSAYQVAVKHGYTGTEVEWVTSLKGDKGEAGAGLNIKGQVETEAQLPAPGDEDKGTAYLVGAGFGALLYIWDGNAWFYKQPLSVKGEDFTYEDFTPEQLELLRGPRGYQGDPVNVERVLESTDDGGVNTVFFTDGTQMQVRNGTKGGKGDPGYTPQKGVDYTDGENGGYYTLQISQVDADTAQVRYTPSKAGMPAVPAETLKLPKGPDGEDGKDYILTDADKAEIAELAADLVDVPEGSAGGGYVAQDTAPEDTTLLWVDTSDDSDDDYQEAVNAALAQAKASGEFNGKDGDPGAPGKDGKDYVLTDTDRAEIAEQAAQMVIDDAPVKSVNGKTGAVTLAATDVGARPSTWTPSATDVGADPKGTANTAVTTHNVATDAHNDLRLLIDGLTSRLNALANSTDEDLDQMAEMVAYIKENRELISGITTNKVNVADIINNLTTNVTNKPLSAAQGVALKALIDAITVPTKLSQLTNDKGYITGYTETDPTVPSWAKAASKPSYSKSEVGLGNVDNVKQYSANNPPPYPVTSVNGKTGAVTVDVPSVPSWAMATSKPSYTASEVGAVPTSRTVNGKALSANISLSASDVGARASTWTPSAAEIKSALGYTPANQATTITITGKDADGNTHTFTVVGWEA